MRVLEECAMQTQEEVQGLQNFQEQPLKCLHQAMQKQQKILYCFYKVTFLRKSSKTLCCK